MVRKQTTADKRRIAHRAEIDADPPHCLHCGLIIDKPRRYVGSVAYCTERCKDKAKDERRRVREAEAAVGDDDGGVVLPFREDQVRTGDTLDLIRDALTGRQWRQWVDLQITDKQVAQLVDRSPSAVGKARRAATNEMILGAHAEGWAPAENYAELLGPSDSDMRELLAENPDVFEETILELVEAFVRWRNEFFTAGVERPYITRPSHKRWIAATLKAIYTGGRTLILSPPRHGKTDLLNHFCVWLICRNPHIRILWVGPNADIGELSLGQVRDLLETHSELQAAYLPPGETWAPQKRGGANVWQQSRFTVANRKLQLRQPTMWATGVGGKILSLDADFIIVDDPADPDASYTPGGRDKILNWFRVKLASRKMDHTGLVMISSRVHPDDLYANFIEHENWDVTVEKAHDFSKCGKDLFADHANEDCVLFPEINPLQYLREQHDDVGPALFDMMYQNAPRPDGTLIFDPDIIEAQCLDISRDLGVGHIGGAFTLVAGLDPAARGIQAAFLWAVQLPSDEEVAAAVRDPYRNTLVETYYMVDMEAQQAGGIEGALRVMTDWEETYGVTLWVVEENSYQKVFFDDPRTKILAAQLSLDIKPHQTGRNKADPDFGVAKMAPLFHEGKINLPYATPRAIRKTDMYIRQLINFTDDSSRQRRNKSDILMAAWFPFAKVIPKWKRDSRPPRVTLVSDFSYPGYEPTDDNEALWGGTAYPYNTEG